MRRFLILAAVSLLVSLSVTAVAFALTRSGQFKTVIGRSADETMEVAA